MPTRTWRGTTDSNWGTSTNWLEGAVPTVADDVVFDASSPACTVNASNRVCLTINFTNYINTITMTFGISVSGNITLGAGMGVGGTGFLAFNNVSATYTPNGFVWPNEFRFISITTSKTYTLASNCSFSGLVTNIGSNVESLYTGGSTITCSGGMTSSSGVRYNGTGTGMTIKITAGSYGVALNGAINVNLDGGSNTITINGFVYNCPTGTFSYTSGVVTASSADLSLGQGTLNLGSNVKWNSITFSTTAGSGTTTLANDLWCNTLIMTSALVIIGDFKIYLNTYTGSTGNVQVPSGGGTKPTLNFNGGTSGATSGTISIPTVTLNAWKLIDIDMPLVTFTQDIFIFGTVVSAAPSFKITSGTVIVPRALLIASALTAFDAPGTIWNNISIGSNITFGTWNLTSDIWCKTLGFGATVGLTLNNFNFYVDGSLDNSNSGAVQGTTTINLIGSGFWVHPGSSTVFSNPLVINTGGTYRLGAAAFTAFPNLYKNGNLNYIKGTVIARGTTLLVTATSTGWVNIHRIAFDTVTITGGTTQTMNEFFGGRPGRFCVVRSSNTTNVTVTFTDGFEKIARWVLPSNITVSRLGQLKMISRSGNRNNTNIGLTYFEGGIPYTVPRNNPIVYQGSQCFGIGDSPADPNFF